MVWVKLSDDFPDAAARASLSDAAFRVHVEGLCWAMRRENGGLLDWLDVRKACEIEDPKAAVRELVDAGWWAPAGPDGQSLQVVQSMDDQPEPDVIEARRHNDAERQRRKRRKAVGLDLSRRDDPRDSYRDDPRDPGRDGSGRDGAVSRSTDKSESHARARARAPAREGETEDWSNVAIPGFDTLTAAARLERHVKDYCEYCGQTNPKHTPSCRVRKKAA